jgi:hypothetical protein
MRRDSHFGDTVNPELVGVSCDRCGTGFQTTESSARARDQKGEPFLCDRCKDGRKPAPSETELENPTPDAVHDRTRGVGPDAEPDISIVFPDGFEFGDIVTADRVPLVIKKGTKTLGRVVVCPDNNGSLYLPVEIAPRLEMLDDDVSDAIVSALSGATQKLIEVK